VLCDQGFHPGSRATRALVRAPVPDRGSNPRVLHLPSIQGGAQITIDVRLGNPFGERNGERLPLERRSTLQGADEVGEIGDETMVDSCLDDKTGRRGGLTPSRHASIKRGTQRDARRHTGKPTEPLSCKTPKRRRQRRETTTLAGGSRLPPEQPSHDSGVDESDAEREGLDARPQRRRPGELPSLQATAERLNVLASP
jgi:hypothetical protein